MISTRANCFQNNRWKLLSAVSTISLLAVVAPYDAANATVATKVGDKSITSATVGTQLSFPLSDIVSITLDPVNFPCDVRANIVISPGTASVTLSGTTVTSIGNTGSLSASETVFITPGATDNISVGITVSPIDSGQSGCTTSSSASTAVVSISNIASSITAQADSATFGSAAATAGSLSIDVLSNDDGATSISSVSQPSNGTASISGTSIIYIPNTDFSGTDSFSYIPANSTETGSGVTVTVNVTNPITATPEPTPEPTPTPTPQPTPTPTSEPTPTPVSAPVATNDSANVATGSQTIVPVTSNDSGTISSVSIVSQPQNGTATVSGSSVQYVPNEGFVGQDSFTYQVTNAGGSSSATVVIDVLEVKPIEETSAVEQVQKEQTIANVKATVGLIVKRVSTFTVKPQRVRSAQPSVQSLTGIMGVGSGGLAAGDDMDAFGVWGTLGYSNIEDDFTSTAFDGDVLTGLVGADLFVNENLLIGGTVGMEKTDIDTRYNAGTSESDGLTMALYTAYIVDDMWSVEGLFGYANTNTDMTRSATGIEVRGETDSQRLYGSFAANANFYPDDYWTLSGSARYTFATEHVDEFTETDGTFVPQDDVSVGIIQLGGRASWTDGKFEPFGSLSLEYENVQKKIVVPTGNQPANDRTSAVIGGGLNYYADENLSGGFEVTHTVGKKDFKNTSFSLNIRYDF